jgi:hypothetical protein
MGRGYRGGVLDGRTHVELTVRRPWRSLLNRGVPLLVFMCVRTTDVGRWRCLFTVGEHPAESQTTAASRANKGLPPV